MNDDLIKRNDAVEVVYKALKTPPLKGVLTDTMSLAIALVQDIPSADRPHGDVRQEAFEAGFKEGMHYERKFADRPQGEWIKDNLGTVICSECKRPRRDNRIGHVNFCNSCGARMKGADDGSR